VLNNSCLLFGLAHQLDPRIWNSQDLWDANVPAAGGRFSAAGLAHFYTDLFSGRILDTDFLYRIQWDPTLKSRASLAASLQGVTHITADTPPAAPAAATTPSVAATADVDAGNDSSPTKIRLGYQVIRTDRDTDGFYSGLGHAGVGGSIGFVHRPTGISIAVMLNKADGGQPVTERILRMIADHYEI